MYAAAGGASLASRQARQRQRQQYNKNKALLQQQRLAQQKAGGVATPTKQQQSRPFHQLPATYLRTPQTEGRKLSAGYAGQSKLLLPIVEGNNQQQSLHFPHHQQFESYTRPISPRPSIRPDQPSFQQLHKSATATLPLNQQVEPTPPTTPIGPGKPGGLRPSVEFRKDQPQFGTYSHVLPVPQDAIIVTPATPLTSPGHRSAADQQEGVDGAIGGQLERKCSFYRVRRSDAFDQDATPTSGGGGYPGGLTVTTAQNQLDVDDEVVYGLPNGGSGHKWTQQLYYCAYCEDGSYCEHIECAQGRAAWLERGRRCSVQNNNPASCHRRWVKRNRVCKIQDSSLGGSSDDEDLLGILRGPSSFANAFLYVGLGTVAIGLVIAFVGTGEKGFKTVELRLIGPSLIGLGLICCILRICFCICPSNCLSKNKKARKKEMNKIDADHTTSLLRGETKRVSIATKHTRHKFQLGGRTRANSKMLNEGMEALRQIATTSLFLQNDQKPSTNRIVPIIKEPEKQSEAPLEMKKLETTLNISDITDDEDEDDVAATTSSYHNQIESLVKSESKLARQRLPTNQSQSQHRHHDKFSTTPSRKDESETLLMETSLMVVNPTPSTSTAGKSSLPVQPSSSRDVLELPIEKRQFLPPSVPLVHSPPAGTSSTATTVPYARPGPSSGSSHHSHQGSLRSPPPQAMSVTSASGSKSAPVTTHSRNFPFTNSNMSATNATITTTIAEPELVLSPAKLGQ